MVDLTLSRLFERYRSENDLAALAEVFDRVSPDLLRVARHVAGRGVEPEDLVQGTFLAAIERSATFDAQRPLLPWLLGILVNQSRRPRRRDNRGLAEDSESAIPARPDHENDAESHEIDAAVTRALAELPERYREVLVPHLSEGKDPHVIALELGRPQGTVRAQIHRGIRLMRRILPTGFALGGYGGVSSDALQLVRARVLEQGAHHIGRGPDAIADVVQRSAARAMRRRTTVVGTVAVLGVALWLAWPTSDAPVLPREIVAESASIGPDRALDLTHDSGRIERAPLAVDTPPRSANASILEYGSVVVNVRESDAEEPARGALVSLFDWASPRWFENVREARTDASGVVRFDQVHPGRVGIHVERGPQTRDVVFAHRETTFFVRRPNGIELEVVVRGVDGALLAGTFVDVHARRDEPPVTTGAPTDALGRVRIERAPNECFVTARADGHVTSNMAWSGLRTAQDVGPVRFEIALERGGSTLQGIVIDDHGATIAGARVQLSSATRVSEPIWRADGSPTFEPAPLQTETDANGRFHFEGLRCAAVILSTSATGRGKAVSRVVPFAGRFSVESVRVGPEATLKGVSRFADGSPAPNAHIEVVVEDEPVLDTRSGRDGSYVLRGLPCGRVLVRARAGPYGPLTTREIVLHGNEPLEWNPTLVSGSTIAGRAIEQDGRVMSTWLVLATPEDEDSLHPLARWARAQVPAPVDDLALQNRIPPTGVFVVPCRSTAPHRLELRGRNGWREAPQASLSGVQPGACDVVMPVAQARGRIQGRFVDERGRPAAMARVIAVAGGSSGECVGLIDHSSGRFDIETLAGTFEVLAWTPAGVMHHFGRVDVLKPRTVELGDRIVLDCGEIVITAPEHEPRSLELLGTSGLRFELVPSAERMWRARKLQPGHYTLRTTSVAGKVSDVRIELAAGSVTRVTWPRN